MEGRAISAFQIPNHKPGLKINQSARRVSICPSNETGSVTVFVLLMTLTLTMVFAALVSYGSKQTRHAETLRSLELASQSVLHTYDRRLLEDYSLLAVDLEVAEPSAYLTVSFGPNFRWKRPERTWSFRGLHTLDQPAHFMEAIRQAVAVGIADEVLNRFSGHLDEAPKLLADGPVPGADLITGLAFEDALAGEGSAGSGSRDGEGHGEVEEGAAAEDKALAAKAIRWIRQINAADEHSEQQPASDRALPPEVVVKLPSRVYSGSKSRLSLADKMPFVFYVTHHFGDRVSDLRAPFYKASPPEAFFDAETEYILYGHDAEVLNISRAYADVYLMRLAGNVAHVLACRPKQELIAAVAGAVNAVVGIPLPITSSAIVLTWGMAESRSDMQRLLSGENLPWVHVSEAEWRTRFGAGGDAVAADEKETLRQGDMTGADYGDHLAALLSVKAGMSHVLRVMDLISIGNGERGIDLSQRTTRFVFWVEASQGLPEVIWEDGFGFD